MIYLFFKHIVPSNRKTNSTATKKLVRFLGPLNHGVLIGKAVFTNGAMWTETYK